MLKNKTIKKLILLFTLMLCVQQSVLAQCNPGLNLGAVIVPTHGNVSNNGNFTSSTAWQQAAIWVDTLNLDYRQPYISWTDVVTGISAGVPAYNPGTVSFQNQLNIWAGNPDVHVVYPTIKVGAPNTLEKFPTGFGSFTSFLDTAYINQNYNAIKYILSGVNNVRWISIGNEIETYFRGAYLNTGRLTQYATFLDTMKNRIHADFPNVKVGTVVAFHTLNFSNQLNLIDSVLNSVDYIGYTFYYTTSAVQNCWDSPATVETWLNTARGKAGSKKMLITETCMGDGGGSSQNCGSPSKQLNYADTLLRWYKNNISNIEGMTWFTITDPYLSWQTSNTLWNTCGLIDSNGMALQPAGTLWRHSCPTSGINALYQSAEISVSFYPNPFSSVTTLQTSVPLKDATLTVYSTFEEVKQIKHISGSAITLQRENLANGIYFICITQNNKVIRTGKLLIAD